MMKDEYPIFLEGPPPPKKQTCITDTESYPFIEILSLVANYSAGKSLGHNLSFIHPWDSEMFGRWFITNFKSKLAKNGG